MNKRFRQYIEQKRMHFGLSQREFSLKIGMACSWYTQFIENPERSLRVSTLIEMAKVLEETPHQLLDAYMNRNPNTPRSIDPDRLEGVALELFRTLPLDSQHRLQQRLLWLGDANGRPSQN